MDDVQTIRHDIHELFSFRRTFRDVADVFRGNDRLQAAGGHLWDWMRLNYAASVLIRVRRQVDTQPNTVNLRQLLLELSERPNVVTRARRARIHDDTHDPIEDQWRRQHVDDHFSETWVREFHDHPGDDHIASEVIANDLTALEDATERVARVASRNVAHRNRVSVADLQIPEVDAAFEAIEATLKKYYTLLNGNALLQAEPAPQFNTHEVFTFPWIEG